MPGTASFFLQFLAMVLPIGAAAVVLRILVTEFEKERDVARTLANLRQARRSFLDEVAFYAFERADLERRVHLEHGRSLPEPRPTPRPVAAVPAPRPTPRPTPAPTATAAPTSIPAQAPRAASLRSVPPAALGAAVRQMMAGGVAAPAAAAASR